MSPTENKELRVDAFDATDRSIDETIKTTLVLLTSHYPFDRGEEFLEVEMPFLCSHFDEVCVIACGALSNSPVTRSLPANAVAIGVGQGLSAFNRIALIIRNAMAPLALRETLSDEDKKAVWSSPRCTVAWVLFATRCQALRRKLRMILKMMNSKRTKLVIYSYWFRHSAVAALLCSRQFSSVVVSRAHGTDLYDYANRNGWLPSRNWILNHINRVFAVSDHGKQYLDNRYANTSDVVHISRLGTEDRGLGPWVNLTGRRVNLVSCSSITPIKRVHLIVEAVGLLQSVFGDVINWTHLGGGNNEPTIRELASRTLCPGTWSVTGTLKHEEVMSYLTDNVVDLFLNASSSEGLPVSMMEAISFGIPVIATNVGGVSEIITPIEMEYLISDEEVPSSMCKVVMLHLEKTVEEHQELRDRARGIWEQYYSADRNYGAFAQELHDLLD